MAEHKTLNPHEYSDGLHYTVTLPLVAEVNDRPAFVVGSATIIGRFLALTAKHCIQHVLNEYRFDSRQGREVSKFNIRLYQVQPPLDYFVWEVLYVWLSERSDMALLELDLSRSVSGQRPKNWFLPQIQIQPPTIGTTISAIGHTYSKVRVSDKDDGDWHIDLDSQHLTAKGNVTNVFQHYRDRYLISFPSFETNVRFERGMSGGPVIDHSSGMICGIVSSSIEERSSNPEGVSYAASIWPALFAQLQHPVFAEVTHRPKPRLYDLIAQGILRNFRGMENLDPEILKTLEAGDAVSPA